MKLKLSKQGIIFIFLAITLFFLNQPFVSADGILGNLRGTIGSVTGLFGGIQADTPAFVAFLIIVSFCVSELINMMGFEDSSFGKTGNKFGITALISFLLVTILANSVFGSSITELIASESIALVTNILLVIYFIFVIARSTELKQSAWGESAIPRMKLLLVLSTVWALNGPLISIKRGVNFLVAFIVNFGVGLVFVNLINGYKKKQEQLKEAGDLEGSYFGKKNKRKENNAYNSLKDEFSSFKEEMMEQQKESQEEIATKEKTLQDLQKQNQAFVDALATGDLSTIYQTLQKNQTTAKEAVKQTISEEKLGETIPKSSMERLNSIIKENANEHVSTQVDEYKTVDNDHKYYSETIIGKLEQYLTQINEQLQLFMNANTKYDSFNELQKQKFKPIKDAIKHVLELGENEILSKLLHEFEHNPDNISIKECIQKLTFAIQSIKGQREHMKKHLEEEIKATHTHTDKLKKIITVTELEEKELKKHLEQEKSHNNELRKIMTKNQIYTDQLFEKFPFKDFLRYTDEDKEVAFKWLKEKIHEVMEANEKSISIIKDESKVVDIINELRHKMAKLEELNERTVLELAK